MYKLLPLFSSVLYILVLCSEVHADTTNQPMTFERQAPSVWPRPGTNLHKIFRSVGLEPFVEDEYTSSPKQLRDGDNGGANCTNDTTCGGSSQGQCVSGRCVCREGYANRYCTYSRKSAVTAFLLGFFVGEFGADRFYLGYTGMGAAKCVLGGMTIVGAVLSAAYGLGAICLIPCGLTIWCWWLIDWAMIADNNVDDADGFSLERDW